MSAHCLTFKNQSTAWLVDLQNDESVAVALGQVLNIPRKTLVVVGGANGLSNKDRHRLETLFTEVICPLCRNP